MTAYSWDPALTAYSRVFTIKFRARPDHEPVFETCAKAGSLDQSFGDIEKIECPDPAQYGGFIEVGRVQGSIDRAGTSLTARFGRDIESRLLHLAKVRCALDVQFHLGACTDPRVFNKFDKAIILEDAYFTNWSSEDIGALSSDENAAITESVDVSVGKFYEVLPLTFQERATDIVMNEIVDVVICDRVSCGDECDTESQGCDKIYALAGATEGSPGTAPDVIYSIDGGAVWALNEINSLIPAEAANAIACLDEWLVAVSNDSNSLHYKAIDDVNNGVVGGWVEVTTGFVATHEPNDIWSVGYASFIVGDLGYVYYCTEPSAGVSVLDAGVVTANTLNAVHAIDDTHAVAVGDSDTVIYTTNRTNWQATTASPTSGGNLQGVWMKNDSEWWVVSDNGECWYTLDAGESWTQKTLAGTVSELHDIAFGTNSLAYVCGRYQNTGRAWRSFNGGYDFVALPEGTGSLPTARDLNALAACDYDPNFLVLVGEGENADDGIIMLGED